MQKRTRVGVLGVGMMLFLPLMLASCGVASVNAILISDLAIPPGEIGTIVVSASRIIPGLQGIEVSARSEDFLTFDPQILEVTGVRAVEPFSLDAVSIDNAKGRISFIARTPATGPFPSNGPIVEVIIRGLKRGRSLIELSVTNLADPENRPLLNVRVGSGSVTVGRVVEF